MQIGMRNVKLCDREVARIYREAFPKGERMPFPMMVAMAKLPQTQFWAAYEGETCIGLVYLALGPTLVFLMFLAVDRPFRSKGYGSAILREIGRCYPDRKVFVSIEPCDECSPDLTIRQKRKAFYLRNGYRETGHHIQLAGKWQELLLANGSFDSSELRSFFLRYSNGTMRPKIQKSQDATEGSEGNFPPH